MKRFLPALVLLMATANVAHAAPLDGLNLMNALPAAHGTGASYSLNVETLLLITGLAFLPGILLLMTAFTRIIIVLSVLRQALGLQTTPPNMVLAALAMALTVFVMHNVIQQEQTNAVQPYLAGQISFSDALTAAEPPIQDFMLAQTRTQALHLFVDLSQGAYATPKDIPLTVLVPDLHPVRPHRSCGGVRADVAWHDYGLADIDLAAAEIADVRFDPWLGAGAGLACA